MRYTLEAAGRGYSESEERLVSEELAAGDDVLDLTDDELIDLLNISCPAQPLAEDDVLDLLDLSWLEEEEE